MNLQKLAVVRLLTVLSSIFMMPLLGFAQDLHLLMVADSRANLAGFQITKANVGMVFKAAKAAGLPVKFHHIPDDQVSPSQILAEIDALKAQISSDDSVVVYYIGHGGTYPGIGHVLLTSGGEILRSEVRYALQQLGTRFVCLLTDCCSSKVGGEPAAFAPALSPIAIKLIRSLFLESSGIVDITAATFEPDVAGSGLAFHTGSDGGIFTQSFFLSIFSASSYYERIGDELFTWKGYFELFSEKVDETFHTVKRLFIENGNATAELMRTQHQKPMAFQLGTDESKDGAIWVTVARQGKTPRLGAVMHTSYGFGVVINRIIPGSAAEKVVVKRVVNGQVIDSVERMLPGDLISTANGNEIKTVDDLFKVIDAVPSGGELVITGRDKSTMYRESYNGIIVLP